MSKPAHKQDDPSKAPGQIVNDLTDHPAARPFNEHILADYINRKYSEQKKMTFDEWVQGPIEEEIDNIDPHWQVVVYALLLRAWKAGQENK